MARDFDGTNDNISFGDLPAISDLTTCSCSIWVWNDVSGYLAKSEGDYGDYFDVWNLDLKVPCFEGNCGQDWADYVHGINPSANPDDYVQPIGNEHKLFGCDIWIEVTGISED